MLAASVLAVACARPHVVSSPSFQVKQVIGIVTLVEGTSPERVSRFTLRTPTGEFLRFDIGDRALPPGFPPAHLHEHQATAQPVLVDYVEEGSRLVVVALADAP